MKKVISIVIMFIVSFVMAFSVKAEKYSEATYTTRSGSFPGQLTKPFLGQSWSNTTTNLVGRFDNGTGLYLFYKYASNESVATLCTSFSVDNKLNTMDSNYFYKNNCSKITGNGNPFTKGGKDWSNDPAVASGVASIIIEATGGLNKKLSLANYHTAELAVNYYLAGTDYKSDKNVQYKPGKKLASVGDNAEDEYNYFSNKKKAKNKKMTMEIVKGSFKCTKQNNTTGNCKMKINTTNISNYSNNYSKVEKGAFIVKVDGQVVDYNYNSSTHELQINGIDILNNAEHTIKVDLPVTRTFYKAQNYKCGNNQTLTPNIFVKGTQTIHFTLTKTTTLKNKTSVDTDTFEEANMVDCAAIFSKVSTNNVPLEGSSIEYQIRNANNEIIVNGTGDSAVQLNDPYTASGVVIGDEEVEDTEPVYNTKCLAVIGQSGLKMNIISEKTTPIGYKYGSVRYADGTPISADGTIEIDSDSTKEIQIVNIPDTNLIIKKVDGSNGNPVDKTKMSLSLYGKNLKIVDTGSRDENGYRILKVAGECPDGTDCSWETDTTGGVHFVELDYNEKYQINEVASNPDYRPLKDYNDLSVPVTLTLPESQEASQNDSYDDETGRNQTIVLTNFKSSISFSKQDITNGKEVVGAHLKVIDGMGNVMEEWDSTSTPHTIKNLADADYYLVETIAPSGYELNETKVAFSVKNGKPRVNDTIVNSVVITNSPKKISVANTILGKKIITYVLGFILIVGGAGVLGYELKKKKAFTK